MSTGASRSTADAGRAVANVVVRDARLDDLSDVARLHLEAFPDSVLGRLGLEAVRRSYEWQLTGPHELTALVGTADGRLDGFLFGGIFRGSTIGFLRRDKWFLVRQVVRHPGVFVGRLGRDRLVLALRLLARRPQRPAPENPAAVPDRSFGVLSIAVDPNAQGSGIGRRLMAEATKRAAAAGFVSIHLSVHPDNRRAVEFYESLGFSRVLEPSGEWVGRMRVEIPRD